MRESHRTQRRLRGWTMSEVAMLRLWRTQPEPLPIPECARRLGRSVSSVLGQATRQRIVVQEHYPHGYVFPLVRRFVRHGFTDAEIARAIRRTRSAVRQHRRALGLAANRARRKPEEWPECWLCAAVCPTGPKATKPLGWASRPTTVRGLAEIYCGPCFQKWGWPPLTNATRLSPKE